MEKYGGRTWGLQGNVRPVVVISAPVAGDDYALLATVPHTTSDHPSQYAVPIKASGLKEGAFNVQGLAPVPLSKFVRRITTLTPEQSKELDAAVKRWLCLA